MTITMDDHDHDDANNDDVYWGAGFVPLVFVEVVPLLGVRFSSKRRDDSHHSNSNSHDADAEVDERSNHLSSVFVKSILRDMCRIPPVDLSSSSLSLSLSSPEVANGLEIEWINVETTTTRPEPRENHDIPFTHVQHQCKPELTVGYLWWRAIDDDDMGQPPQQQRRPTRVLFGDPAAVHPHDPRSVPVVFLPSNDPTHLEPIPCVVKGYGTPTRQQHSVGRHHHSVLVTSSTLVRIVPPRPPWGDHGPLGGGGGIPPPLSPTVNVYHQLLGEAGHDFLPPHLQDEVLDNHNPETVRALEVRLSMQCSRDIRIGTTPDALRRRQESLLRDESMTRAIQERMMMMKTMMSSSSTPASPTPSVTPSRTPLTRSSIPWEASILVHSPNHADGKTLLVQAVAQKIGCTRIHILRSGPLLARYGVYADVALESILHGILVSAAVESHPAVCIILDHLDTIMPPQLSGRSGDGGDASIPVLNAMAAYLQAMTRSMEESQEFPFPRKNSLYNPGAYGGSVLSVRLCLVGIVTCPDDGWRSVQMNHSSVTFAATTILDSLQGGRYRLPSLTAPTRFKAFSAALQRAQLNVLLDEPARRRLPGLAASAGWAKGRAFQRVATELLLLLASSSSSSSSQRQSPNVDPPQDPLHSSSSSSVISRTDLEGAFARVQAMYSDFANVSFQSAPDASDGNGGDLLFDSVGGNVEAKEALEDALALEPAKRQLLAKFGMSTPTGILLYGPPGCGKTLLAKAVVRLLKSPTTTAGLDDAAVPLGGTFISMGSSDLVRAEIGTSEKMLVSVFDFADKNAPSVIFLDEFQALFTERSRGGSGKLASILLQCMDDIKRWSAMEETPDDASGSSSTTALTPTIAHRVVVLGATNTPWMVDSAFLRSGRFDRVVHVGLPTLTERASILRVHMSHMKIKEDVTHHDAPPSPPPPLQLLCQSLAQRTEGFSGADLAALCRAAAIRALSEEEQDCWIEERHFQKALEVDVRASSDARLVDRLLRWKP